MQYRRHQGFAVPVVLLVGAVILVSVVTAASVSALGSRINVSDEKVAYQALLTAESGINTFIARSQEYSYTGLIEESPLNSWLSDNGLDTVTLGDGNVAVLEVVDADPTANSFTLQATGNISDGRALKLILNDYSMDMFSGNLGIAAPAALTSIPKITINGNATINGLSSDEADWEFNFTNGKTTASTMSNPSGFDLSVEADIANAATRGGYVEVDGDRYLINSADPSTNIINLTPANAEAATPVQIASGLNVTYIPFATSEIVTMVDDEGVSEVPTTNSDQFRVGDIVYIGPYSGVVQSITETSIFVKWDINVPDSSVPITEGTTITRTVLGAVSDGSISQGNKQRIFPDSEQYADLPSGDELFESVFGITKQQMQQAAAAQGQLYPTWDALGTEEREQLSGITYISAGTDANVQFCGSGIVVVEGDLKTQNAPCDFTGVIYVTGDWQEQGNRKIVGAVVVEGEITTEVCSDNSNSANCLTDVNGTNDKIHYDPVALMKVGENVSYSTGTFTEVPQTWRQR